MTTATSDDSMLHDISLALSAHVCSHSIDAFVGMRARAAAERKEQLRDLHRKENSRNLQDLCKDLDP